MTAMLEIAPRSAIVPPFPTNKTVRPELGSTATHLRSLAASKAQLEARLAAYQTEMSTVVRLLHASELNEARLKKDIVWLVSVGSLLVDRPKWWFVLLPGIQNKLLHRRIRRRKLFDPNRYLSRYPDVVSSGQDPLGHYIRHGLGEGRVNDVRT